MLGTFQMPNTKSVAIGQIEIGYTEWHTELSGKGPTLLFVHATGFHGRIWDQVIAALPACHCIALDQRGHGHSTGSTVSHWSELGADIAGVIAALDLRDVIGIGHSVGGHTIVQAASGLGSALRQLVLIDPVIFPKQMYGPGKSLFPKDEGHHSKKRQQHFASVDAMIDALSAKVPMRYFDPAVLRDYATYGTRPAEDGNGVTLRCDPIVEANTFETALSNTGVFEAIAQVAAPVLILRAQEMPGGPAKDLRASPSWPGLAGAFSNAREMQAPDWTHFLPMQHPAELAGLIAQECALPTPA